MNKLNQHIILFISLLAILSSCEKEIDFSGQYDSGIAVYAIAVPDEPVDEEYGYFALKEAIIKQAAEKGIEKERLAFWYDGQEQYLSKAAKVGCEEVLVAKPKCRVIAAIIQILEHRTKCALVLV